jgi:hypothetical protein
MYFRRTLVLAALSLTSGVLLSGTAGAAIDIGIGVSVNLAPPVLPVYEQPAVPGPGYLWAPGYWAWGDSDYYWVPGTWVMAPQPGYLWTPGYWGWGDGAYLWHGGYWGPHVGFYGGVNYGFGYGGSGYAGGEWRGGTFFYNRSVNTCSRATLQITNVYNRTVVNNVTVNRVSFNGGNGGIAAQPSAAEMAAAHERHLPPVGEQVQHEQVARANPQLRASVNHGAPAIAATAHAGAFTGPGVVGAKGAAPTGPAHAAAPLHPAATPPVTTPPAAPSTRRRPRAARPPEPPVPATRRQRPRKAPRRRALQRRKSTSTERARGATAAPPERPGARDAACPGPVGGRSGRAETRG